jgi:hypothetical protein
MKRSILAVSLTATLASAGSVQHGFDVMVGYDLVTPGSKVVDDPAVSVEGKGGLSLAVGPSFTFPIQEKLGVALGVLFLYDQFGFDESKGAISQTEEVGLMSFGLQLCPTYRVMDALTLKAGYEWDIPFGGSAEIKGATRESRSYDIVWAPASVKDFNTKTETPFVSVHNLLVGAAYDVTPGVGIAVQGKFALNGNDADYGDEGNYKGAKKDEENFKVKQISMGLAYRFQI